MSGGQRDDTDVPRHVNNMVLDGQRNDIEIYRYNDIFGFECSEKSLDARSFISEDGKQMAVVVAHQDMGNAERISAQISAPGYRFLESSVTGSAQVSAGRKIRVNLGQYDMAVLLYEKE